MGCQDGSGASGYHAPGVPACGRPSRSTRPPARQSPPLPRGADVYAPFHRPDAFDPPTLSPLPTPLVPIYFAWVRRHN